MLEQVELARAAAPACLGYGAEPATFQDYVDKGMLPKARATSCRNEYQRVKRAFALTMLAYIDQEQMKKCKRASGCVWRTASSTRQSPSRRPAGA